MIELVFLACLSATPGACQEQSLLYTDVSPMTCVLGAQPELAKWVESHPKYTVARWRCQPVDGSRKI